MELSHFPRRGHVLVVDDEPMMARAVGRTLETQHHVELAASGRDALRRVAAGERFDLIVCDLMMPHMSGIDLYAELSRVSPELASHMVFMTGGAFTKAARAFLDQVPNPRIEKPFDGEQLRALVNHHLK